MSAATNDACGRCKGKGWGDWVVEHGICYACRGTGSKAVAQRRRAQAKAEAQFRAEVEDASVLVHVAADAGRERAVLAFCEAFDVLPADVGTRLAPGWFAFTLRAHPSFAGFDEDGNLKS